MKTLAIALVFAAGLAAEVQKKDVEIKAPDGVTLKGNYFSAGRPGPAMLLMHQCNMDRHAWDGLAGDLAAAGINVLTFDTRGFGESGGTKAERDKWSADTDAAYELLTKEKGVDPARIAVGGASCGVTLSSDLAARHPEIKALIVLSGRTGDATRSYIASNPALPVFGAASEGDTEAANGIRAVVAASKNPKSVLKIYDGTEHGVPMFAKHSELEPMIVNWVKTELALPRAGGTH